MLDWFNEISTFEKVYWIAALISSLIFLVVMIATFVGGDTDVDTDVDADVDGGGFQFFTFKNLVGFFLIFSWSGLACVRGGQSTGITLVISIFCGLLMMFAMASVFYFLNRLVEDGGLKLSNAIGRTGEVYLPILGNNKGFGKVQMSIQGSVHEIQAMTNDEEDLPNGTLVRVEKVVDNQILVVTRKLT
jgi:membrane protein implicated in regulation of membrane protease activity